MYREPDSGRFFSSDLNSATAYDALSFATAEGAPDDLEGMIADHRQMILLGKLSGEIWDNTGASGFPFERAINGFFEQGCINGETLVKINNTVIWVADDKTVRRLDGVTPVRVSTHDLEQALKTATLSSAKAFTYKLEGHLVYVLTFPEGAWCLDLTTNLWHERETFGKTTWDIGSMEHAFGVDLVGSSIGNAIGELSPTTYDEFSVTQRAEWTYQPIYAEQTSAFHDRLEMVFEPGVGLTTGQGSDPEIMLQYSDDGGITWNSLPNKKLGKIGKYGNRVVWSAIGSTSQRVYRGAVSDPVKLTLVDTIIEVRGGRL